LIVEKHYDLTEVELARPAESSASAGGMGLRMFTRITLVASFLCSSFVLQSLGSMRLARKAVDGYNI
jgi:hypothetical protein